MDMEQAHEVMSEALSVAGTSWVHGLVIPSPRGELLVSMSLAADVLRSAHGTGEIIGKSIKNTYGVSVTEFTFVLHRTALDGPKDCHKISLVPSAVHGGPEVLLFSAGNGQVNRAMAMAKRFGGFVMADHLGYDPSCTYVKPMHDTGSDTIQWSLCAERIILKGTTESVLVDMQRTMRASGMTMSEDMVKDIRNTMMTRWRILNIRTQEYGELHGVACRHADELSMPMSSSMGTETLNKVIADRNVAREYISERLLHGIVAGLEDHAILETCMNAIPWEADIKHPHAKNNRASLVNAVTSMRLSITGCAESPSPVMTADGMTADGMTADGMTP